MTKKNYDKLKKKYKKKYFTTHFFYNKCKRCQKRKKHTLKIETKKETKHGVWTSLGVLVLFYYLGMHTQVLAD